MRWQGSVSPGTAIWIVGLQVLSDGRSLAGQSVRQVAEVGDEPGLELQQPREVSGGGEHVTVVTRDGLQ